MSRLCPFQHSMSAVFLQKILHFCLNETWRNVSAASRVRDHNIRWKGSIKLFIRAEIIQTLQKCSIISDFLQTFCIKLKAVGRLKHNIIHNLYIDMEYEFQNCNCLKAYDAFLVFHNLNMKG